MFFRVRKIKILFNERLDQAFALKYAVELFRSNILISQAFKHFRENQKLNQVFQKFAQRTEKLHLMFEKFNYVFGFYHNLFCPNQVSLSVFTCQCWQSFLTLICVGQFWTWPFAASLTHFSLQILNKTQTWVFPIYGFLVNPS